jgi:hypothetical protein
LDVAIGVKVVHAAALPFLAVKRFTIEEEGNLV